MNQNKKQDTRFRAFIGLPIPLETKKLLQKTILPYQQELENYRFNWIPSEEFHITLKFLGNISEKESERLRHELYPLIASCESFEVKLSRMLYLPKKKSPKVLALSASPAEIITELATQIDIETMKFNAVLTFSEFKPHLSIARIPENGIKRLVEIKIPPIYFTAKRIALFRSDLSSSKERYTTEWEIPFEQNFNF